MTVKHPAVYSDKLIRIFADILIRNGCKNVLDPLAGTGKIALVKQHGFSGIVICNEIEPEWANTNLYPVDEWHIGDAADMSWANDRDIWAINVSPVYGNRMCLAHGHKILGADLKWIPVEQIKTGDKIIAFDEYGTTKTIDNRLKRRRWNFGTVLRSEPKLAECVKVTLSNGDSIICTPEHPWLASRYKSGGNQFVGNSQQWIKSKNLISKNTFQQRVHGKWMTKPKKQTGWWVYKQLDTWDDDVSYEAGYLAGILDGEGSLSFGEYGCPKLTFSQKPGEVLNKTIDIINKLGYSSSSYSKSKETDVVNVFINGGFGAILKILGSIRPIRLLSKLNQLDIKSRTIRAEKVQVIAIEPAGLQWIQEIESSTKTYIGEGYLMHNSDHHNARDNTKRITYKHYLGRDLNPENAGQMQWGDAYRKKHVQIWTECYRVLRPDGIFILNISDHIRKGKLIPVSQWHSETLQELGFKTTQYNYTVETPRMRFGQNRDVRVEYEYIMTFKKPE